MSFALSQESIDGYIFSDVSSGDEGSTAIQYVKDRGIVKGYSDLSFRPDATINRAEFTKIIVEAVVGQEPLEHAGSCFSDVESGVWFYPYVCYANRVGWINGYPDGSFGPANMITFVEAAKIVSIAYGSSAETDVIWYRPYVMELVNKKAAPASVDNVSDQLTRAEMAEIIYRLNENIRNLSSKTYEELGGQNQAQEEEQTGFQFPYSSTDSNTGAEVSMMVSGSKVVLTSNGIPNHETGAFPNAGNPNSISEQDHRFEIPLNPSKNSNVTTVELGKFGMGMNGIPFDPGAAEFWNNDRNSGWQYEALSGAVNLGLDQNNAHVQPTGSYHYHGIPSGILSHNHPHEHSELAGFAADGFPIYVLYSYSTSIDINSPIREMKSSFRVRSGTRSGGPGGLHDGSFVQDYEYVEGLGDLDECNGREGYTPEFPEGTYAYFLTNQFPFIPRCFRGTPDPSFQQPAGAGPAGNQGAQQGPGAGGPPQAAKDACTGSPENSICSFTDRGNTISGSCLNAPEGFACVPERR